MNPSNGRGPSAWYAEEPLKRSREHDQPIAVESISPDQVAARIRKLSLWRLAELFDPIGFGDLCPRCRRRGTFAVLSQTTAHCSGCMRHLTRWHLTSRILNDHRAVQRLQGTSWRGGFHG